MEQKKKKKVDNSFKQKYFAFYDDIKTPDNDESSCITDSPMVKSVDNNSNNSNSVTDEESVLSDDSDEEDDGLLDGVIMIDPENDSDYTDLLDDVENADDDEVDVIVPIETKKKKSKIFYSNYFTNRLFFGILIRVVKLSYPCLQIKQLKKGVDCI